MQHGEMDYYDDIYNELTSFDPVSLEEMESISLMDRSETKYVLGLNRIPAILKMLNVNYRILEINSGRNFSYHNIYFDTSDFLFFRQHVTGRRPRYKVRFRRYENPETSFLEIKRKNNKNNIKKWRNEGQFSDNDILTSEQCNFLNNYLPFDCRVLKPVLVNSFTRITLAGLLSNERITIDFDLRYSDYCGSFARFPFISIIEVKHNRNNRNSPVTALLKSEKIPVSGFSKYCMGIAAMKDIVAKNNLKLKFLLLNRIENEYFRRIYA